MITKAICSKEKMILLQRKTIFSLLYIDHFSISYIYIALPIPSIPIN